MNYLYNKHFKRGFVLTIVVFILLNIVSYLVASSNYRLEIERQKENGFCCFARYNWGFPFEWWGDTWMFSDGLLGLIINFLVIVSCGFAIGLLFRFFGNND